MNTRARYLHDRLRGRRYYRPTAEGEERRVEEETRDGGDDE
jgi:hypothetical protein